MSSWLFSTLRKGIGVSKSELSIEISSSDKTLLEPSITTHYTRMDINNLAYDEHLNPHSMPDTVKKIDVINIRTFVVMCLVCVFILYILLYKLPSNMIHNLEWYYNIYDESYKYQKYIKEESGKIDHTSF